MQERGEDAGAIVQRMCDGKGECSNEDVRTNHQEKNIGERGRIKVLHDEEKPTILFSCFSLFHLLKLSLLVKERGKIGVGFSAFHIEQLGRKNKQKNKLRLFRLLGFLGLLGLLGLGLLLSTLLGGGGGTTLLLGNLSVLLRHDGPGVDELGVVGGNKLDLALLVELAERNTGQGAVDLQTIDHHGGGDELVCGYFLEDLLEGVLVECDGVVGLVLDLSLGPLLLLLLSSSSRRGLCGVLGLSFSKRAGFLIKKFKMKIVLHKNHSVVLCSKRIPPQKTELQKKLPLCLSC